jgi:nicotinamide mononucleotide adenylyltransferase
MSYEYYIVNVTDLPKSFINNTTHYNLVEKYDTIRFSNDSSQVVLKNISGTTTPDWVNGNYYSHTNILVEMAKPAWLNEDD